MIIVLDNLPKISLNKFYSGIHFSDRKKIKDNFYWEVKAQCKNVMSKDDMYEVEYDFEFKTRPLDISNATGGMVKLIEDVLFEDDAWNVVTKLTIKSRKSNRDRVTIKINEI